MAWKYLSANGTYLLKLRRLGRASDGIWAVDSVHRCDNNRHGLSAKFAEIAAVTPEGAKLNFLNPASGGMYEVIGERAVEPPVRVGVSSSIDGD
ncbi:hypothetical protein A2763_00535 [Candidatus Kaiserbacteria bacterium RIFCSPHIGHO2_01_FULL_54_36]|uniref:Uncharacterized protein n=1 Tax=Candidatus Kaiserbacteria bacterium RIFCSPHIGHO2_01_FULL_54_36 TaxID=1798482 RepID=A0A1F6CLS5_9BACT|nr:MAG: hypothetical protein A2763_00535 [Candidatus Kaiserbacteria bacterium RIFCSPHIGHO2_01_FULL_54_36]OGG75340.1 MAG: hypothetical protein A3A41_01655 [Candidatus Kaiserbacteria bacterium RIFCSPLOWO2_01_FULL_54_22]